MACRFCLRRDNAWSNCLRSIVKMQVDPAPPNVVTRFLRLIRFSHTIFALPFALGALLVAANGHPSLRTLALVLLCMVLARTAAMLFNRLCRSEEHTSELQSQSN